MAAAHAADTPPLLSIVVPAFNCAQYLERSIASAHAFCSRPLEVIVVDDGSSDDTPAVLAQQTVRYPALRCVRKANGGLSSARNCGLAHARGEYVVFLDADDELIPAGALDVLDHRPDLVRLGVEEIEMDGRRTVHVAQGASTTGTEHLNAALGTDHFYIPSWAYAYRRTWLEQHGLSFGVGLIHEDMLFTIQALLCASRMAFLDAPAYRYFRRPGSITTSADEGKIRRRVDSLSQICSVLTRWAHRHPDAHVGQWILHCIDYAATLAYQSTRRSTKWQVLLMELRFLLSYRLWGRQYPRRLGLSRLRRRLEVLAANPTALAS